MLFNWLSSKDRLIVEEQWSVELCSYLYKIVEIIYSDDVFLVYKIQSTSFFARD